MIRRNRNEAWPRIGAYAAVFAPSWRKQAAEFVRTASCRWPCHAALCAIGESGRATDAAWRVGRGVKLLRW
jgi:hypothetical protein